MSDTISVVSPVYFNEASLEKLTCDITAAVQNIFSDYEIILIDDGSKDNSWSKILELSSKNPKIRGIKLSRNFGQNTAIAVGVKKSKFEWICTLDADLQDDPKYIADLFAKAKHGNSIVFARTNNKKTSLVRRLESKTYFWLVNKLTGMDIYPGTTLYTFFNKQVAEVYNRFSDIYRNHLFILLWLGFKSDHIEYHRETRHEGESSYDFSSLVKYALAGIYFQPANFISYMVNLGLFITTGSAIYSIFIAIEYLRNSNMEPGWTSLAVMISFFGGLMLSSIGIVGLYVGKIFEQVKQRPLYIIEKEIG